MTDANTSTVLNVYVIMVNTIIGLLDIVQWFAVPCIPFLIILALVVGSVAAGMSGSVSVLSRYMHC